MDGREETQELTVRAKKRGGGREGRTPKHSDTSLHLSFNLAKSRLTWGEIGLPKHLRRGNTGCPLHTTLCHSEKGPSIRGMSLLSKS